MLKKYVASESNSRMNHAKDLENARKVYLKKSNKNLIHLLKHRFVWMNKFISINDIGIEVGAGIGASRDFIICKSLILTDFIDSPWLDIGNVDVLNTNLHDEQFDFIIASNMIHHLAFPKTFFAEAYRILKPGGKLIIQEIYSSFMMRLILRMMRHEGYNEDTNPFNASIACNDLNDPWSANCSLPKLLFKSHHQFNLNFPQWKIIHDKKTEFFQFLNSGGVVAKTRYLPLPKLLLVTQNFFDRILCIVYPNFFALQNQVVLQKA